ncbi:MFS transporter [Williamsia soli]|uniref:MFS transporter n=1 Tax=Williamsia soli TaxID=364929 RepID=UPI0027DE447B|nr:MFS transporter [Williamsia soli]
MTTDTATVKREERAAGNPWAALAAIAMGVFIVALDGTITAVANPVLAKDLGASLGGLQWITNVYLLALASMLVLAGRLGDRYGKKTIFIVGIIGFGVASVGIGLSPSVMSVIVFRGLQGLFGALIITNALSLLRSTFSIEKLPWAISVFSALIGAASAGGPILGGILVESLSWRWAFLVNAPIAVVSALIGIVVIKQPERVTNTRFDVPGALLLIGALLPLTYGVIHAGEESWSAPLVWVALGAGTAMGIAFLLIERRAADPLVPLRLFRDRSISIGVTMILLTFFAMVGSLFFMLLYLQQVKGDSPMTAGLQLLPMSIANVIGATATGGLIRRWGPRPPLVIGMLLTSAGLALMTTIDLTTDFWGMCPSFAVLGLGIGLVMTASAQAVIGNASEADAGAASGVHQTASQAGGIVGTSVLGAIMATIVARRFGENASAAGVPESVVTEVSGEASRLVAQGVTPPVPSATPEIQATLADITATTFISGMHTTLWIAAVVALGGSVVALFIRRGRQTEDELILH